MRNWCWIKLQTTYQDQVIEYKGQAQAVAAVIQRPKDEKQVTEDSAKLRVERIRSMVTMWRNRTKTSVDDCSVELWMQWSQQAAELQTLRADAENRKKVGDNFYKMDEESIVTIRMNCRTTFSPWPNHISEQSGGWWKGLMTIS